MLHSFQYYYACYCALICLLCQQQQVASVTIIIDGATTNEWATRDEYQRLVGSSQGPVSSGIKNNNNNNNKNGDELVASSEDALFANGAAGNADQQQQQPSQQQQEQEQQQEEQVQAQEQQQEQVKQQFQQQHNHEHQQRQIQLQQQLQQQQHQQRETLQRERQRQLLALAAAAAAAAGTSNSDGATKNLDDLDGASKIHQQQVARVADSAPMAPAILSDINSDQDQANSGNSGNIKLEKLGKALDRLDLIEHEQRRQAERLEQLRSLELEAAGDVAAVAASNARQQLSSLANGVDLLNDAPLTLIPAQEPTQVETLLSSASSQQLRPNWWRNTMVVDQQDAFTSNHHAANTGNNGARSISDLVALGDDNIDNPLGRLQERETPKKYCGKRFMDVLELVCEGRYYTPGGGGGGEIGEPIVVQPTTKSRRYIDRASAGAGAGRQTSQVKHINNNQPSRIFTPDGDGGRVQRRIDSTDRATKSKRNNDAVARPPSPVLPMRLFEGHGYNQSHRTDRQDDYENNNGNSLNYNNNNNQQQQQKQYLSPNYIQEHRSKSKSRHLNTGANNNSPELDTTASATATATATHFNYDKNSNQERTRNQRIKLARLRATREASNECCENACYVHQLKAYCESRA